MHRSSLAFITVPMHTTFLLLILLIFVRVWSKLMIELGIKPSVYSALQVSCQGDRDRQQTAGDVTV